MSHPDRIGPPGAAPNADHDLGGRGARKPSGSGIWRWRPASGYVSWDPGKDAASLFPTRGEMRFKDWIRAVHPADAGAVVAELDHAARRGNPFRLRFRAQGWDGRERWIGGEGAVRSGPGPAMLTARMHESTMPPSGGGTDEAVHGVLAALADPVAVYAAVRGGDGSIVDFELTYVNDAACASTGESREAQLGRRLRQWMSNGRQTRLFQQCRELVDTGQPLRREWRYPVRSHTGERRLRSFDIHASRLGDGFVAVWRDVSSTRAQQADRQHSLEFLQQLIAQSPAAMYVKDLDGRFVLANDMARRGFGPSGQDLVGRTAREASGRPDATWDHDGAALVATGKPQEFEDDVPVDGELRRFQVVEFALRDREGRVASVAGIGTDITGQQRVLAQLEESEARLRLATEAATIGIWTWDLRTDRVFWSQECHTLMGVEQGVHDSAGFRELVHPEDLARMWAAVQDCVQARGSFQADYRIRQPDGSERWMLSTGRCECEEGHPVRMLGVVQDITESKRAQAVLQEAERNKDQFMSMLSHELRNFLAPMHYSMHLLAGRVDRDPESAELLQVLGRQVGSVTRLVDDMLDVARIRSGKLELRPEPVTLAQVAQRTAEACLPVLDGRRQRFEVTGASAGAWIEADPVRLCQALVNLVLNASKFTHEEGAIALHCSLQEGAARFEVADNGAGFDPPMACRLFDIYEQHRTGSHGGLGIGLFLVRHIMELHGGGAEGRSEGPGRGSVFSVWLPVTGGVRLGPDQGLRTGLAATGGGANSGCS